MWCWHQIMENDAKDNVNGRCPNCRTETLRRGEYFGKYGKIVKISVNRNGVYSSSSHGGGPTGSAYVSFSREDDAMRCITQTDGTVLDGQAIRACFGTTKYCNAFLKYQECTNPDCLYLHEIGDHADSFTKEEMLARYGSKHQNFHELTHPLGMATAPPVGTAGESSQGGLPGGPAAWRHSPPGGGVGGVPPPPPGRGGRGGTP